MSGASNESRRECDGRFTMRIRLGTAPVPVPEPFAILIYQLLAHRPNLHTAGAESMYLFPGLHRVRNTATLSTMRA